MSRVLRGRRRPRVRSVTYWRFGWVLMREAALRVLYPVSVGQPSELVARRGLADASSKIVRGAVMNVLQVRPERRTFPRAHAE